MALSLDDLSGTVSAQDLAVGISSWEPFAAQRISVTGIADDFTWVEVTMLLERENANYMGTAFGGSLFSMIDPFFVITLIEQLGADHVVWDKRGEIDFVAPGRGPVHARIEMPADVVAEIREAAAGGEKVLRWFTVDIVADDGSIVATSRRQLHVRRRRAA